MASISINQTSDCTNPLIDVFITRNGVKTDVFSMEFQIFENVTTPGTPIQVYPATVGTRATVDTALCPTGHKLSTGRYVAEWTPTIGSPTGDYIICWFFKMSAAGSEQQFTEEFIVLPEASAAASAGYTTVACLRDEGVTVAMADDARLQALISRVSHMIELYTKRFFEPRTMTFRVDGHGGHAILLDHPIISITSVDLLLTDPFASPSSLLDLDDIRIYNRHISQNLTAPDDRQNPKIEWIASEHPHGHYTEHGEGWYHLHHFPRGTQNIEITGVFGYTDYDGTAYGKTPDLIKHAANLMVIRELPLLINTGDRDEAGWLRKRVTEYKTRDQSIRYSPMNAGELARNMRFSAFTGDPEIDAILLAYSRPPSFGAA